MAVFNWKIALLIMVAVGFHEYSHLFAARQLGLKTGGFYMIPFVGGLALITERYSKTTNKVITVLAGPAGGGLLAAITAGAWYLTGYSWLAISAYWMAILNLFNLLPLSFLDGGQLLNSITYSINRGFGVIVQAISTIAAGIIIWRFNPIIAILLSFFGGMQVYSDAKNWLAFRKGETWRVSVEWLYPPKRLSWLEIMLTILTWLVLGIALLLVMAKLPTSSLIDLLQ